MLTITVPATDYFDERTETFVTSKEQKLLLEHSLVSLSRWEEKHCKPWLGRGEKTEEEILDYIRCMTITQNVDPLVYYALTPDMINEISKYIEHPHTATTINNDKRRPSREILTTEIFYYWMVALNIPFECQKWHLNKLLTLIQVCNLKNNPKKMSKREALTKQRQLNAARRSQLGTSG